MEKIVRIGTRDSQLALWQAQQVKNCLDNQGVKSELVLIKSDGDLDLVTPLYEMGVQGVFTKTLDAALLNGHIDLAVHSMKDVPTMLAGGISMGGVLPRGNYKDVLVLKEPGSSPDMIPENHPVTIATSSIRRRAQWLNKYPHHQFDNLRGNINTRLRKIKENDWFGAIFAAAGLERLGLLEVTPIELNWMLPAPAQGVVCMVYRTGEEDIQQLCESINDPLTFLCATIERDFLRTLMGGCSTPIAALAIAEDNTISFHGKIVSIDGKESKEIKCTVLLTEAKELGKKAAKKLLAEGGAKIVEQIKNA